MDMFRVLLYVAVTTSQVSCTLFNVKTNDSFTLSPSEIPTVAERMSCAFRCQQASCTAFAVEGYDHTCRFSQPNSNLYGDLYINVDIGMCHFLPAGSPSGVYTITPSDLVTTEVYCDMDTVSGGWTVIQHRFDGSQDFYQNWEAYKHGFGSPYGEYWIGNENLYLLTSSGSYELRIEMEDISRSTKYASYTIFSVASESENYNLTISGYTGDVMHNSMVEHRFMPFSTADNDNDGSSGNCAVNNHGGWWYASCHRVNLNGRYDPSASNDASAMCWQRFKSSEFNALGYSKMMIRPL